MASISDTFMISDPMEVVWPTTSIASREAFAADMPTLLDEVLDLDAGFPADIECYEQEQLNWEGHPWCHHQILTLPAGTRISLT